MRVDAHCHAVQERWHTEAWWQAAARRGAELLGVPAEAIREGIFPAYFDEDGSGQLGAMDAAGLDVAVMFPYDWSLEPHLGRPEVGWREIHAWYADLARRSEGRIRWGFGADPRHDGALEALEEAVRDGGAVCAKVHPAGGLPMDDPAAYAVYEKASELGVPVVIHVGPVPPPLESRFSEPNLLDAVARDFPDLPIQAAHTGNEAWREVAAVAAERGNVHCDLSGWQLRSMQDPDRFRADVRTVLDAVEADRVMWGSDAPYFRGVLADAEWIRAFTDAPRGTFSGGETEAILGGTAARFFCLG